ncbi:MAG TPA: aldolase/citrate lyase family protein [Chloroflexota bacterium]|jgi:4-hydroxy-2-oxoheptanedioate aldolase|nr:aldolase/citrate lyase family protein [Chloroflexota bacterium]
MAVRLNKVIALLQEGKVAFGTFLPAGSIPDAYWIATSPYDFVVWEMEHNPYDVSDLRLSLQFMLNRKQIAESGSVAPAVVPFVRIPINGRENNEWIVKQVLDCGVYGIVFPMINTVEDAEHALQAARYPQAKGAPDAEPVGRRGHAPANAVRYWGLTQPEYYEKADVWPLDPNGEILPILQCETQQGVSNLRQILRKIPKPGVILISESDLSVSLGYRGQFTPEVRAAVLEAVNICKEFGVYYGSPQANAQNMAERIADGFQLLMPAPGRDLSGLEIGRSLAGRVE